MGARCAAILALLLAGCTTFDQSVPRKTFADNDQSFRDALAYTAAVRNEYSDQSSKLEKELLFFDLPIIGTAIAGAATIVYGAHTDTIAGVALGSAGLLGVRTYTSNAGRSTIFQQGLNATQCIVDAASPFNSHTFVRDNTEIEGVFIGTVLIENTVMGTVPPTRDTLPDQLVSFDMKIARGKELEVEIKQTAINADDDVAFAFGRANQDLGEAIQIAEGARDGAKSIIRSTPRLIVNSVDKVQSLVASAHKNLRDTIDINAIVSSIQNAASAQKMGAKLTEDTAAPARPAAAISLTTEQRAKLNESRRLIQTLKDNSGEIGSGLKSLADSKTSIETCALSL